MRDARVAASEEEAALMLIGDKPKINLGRMLCHGLDAISLIPPLFKPSNYKRADRFLVFSRVCVSVCNRNLASNLYSQKL